MLLPSDHGGCAALFPLEQTRVEGLGGGNKEQKDCEQDGGGRAHRGTVAKGSLFLLCIDSGHPASLTVEVSRALNRDPEMVIPAFCCCTQWVPSVRML